MGIGRAEKGETLEDAVKTAINNPLTENKIDNAKGVIFNVRGGENLSLTEINTAVQVINDKVSDDANIIFGTVIDESLQDEMALTLNGKRSKFKKRDFMEFATKCGITDKAAEKMIDRICKCEEKFMKECNESYLPDVYIEKTKILIKGRIERLI